MARKKTWSHAAEGWTGGTAKKIGGRKTSSRTRRGKEKKAEGEKKGKTFKSSGSFCILKI